MSFTLFFLNNLQKYTIAKLHLATLRSATEKIKNALIQYFLKLIFVISVNQLFLPRLIRQVKSIGIVDRDSHVCKSGDHKFPIGIKAAKFSSTRNV